MNYFWSVRFEGFSKVRVYGSRSHVGSPGSLLQDVEDCPHRRLSMWLLHHFCTVDRIVSILPAILRLRLFTRIYQLIFRKLHVEALPCAKNAQTPTGFARRCLCGIVIKSFFVHRSMAKLGLVDLVILLMINLRRLTVRLVLVLGAQDVSKRVTQRRIRRLAKRVQEHLCRHVFNASFGLGHSISAFFVPAPSGCRANLCSI